MSSHRRLHGIALMSVAMLTIPIVDGTAKYLSSSYSPLFIGWARYALASVVSLSIAAAGHGWQVFPAGRRRSHVVRTVCLVAAMTLYFLAIARIPMATALSAFFVGPIAAVAFSILLLGEQITRAKIAALGLGAVGSLIILRPGASTDPGVLLALGAGLLFACYLLATRHAAQAGGPLQTLAFQCAVGTLLLTPQGLVTWQMPAWDDAWLFLLMGGVSAMSHLLSIIAFRRADASTLSPLVYLELVGTAIIGLVIFHEIPDRYTIAGGTLIVLAGLSLLRPQGISPSAVRGS
jgi:drug/metabolite transporter (DMT)-like permease